jgi:hypothetical protein
MPDRMAAGSVMSSRFSGGGQHRADGGALAVVAVGHHRDVLVDERHRGRVEDLLERFRLDGRRRREEDGFFAQPMHA